MAVPARQARLTDGRIVSIRQLDASDTPAVLRLHEQLPEHDRYLRFFTLGSAHLAAFATRLTTPDDAHRGALGTFSDGELLGVAHYEVLDDPAEAEVALVVNHAIQAHGVAPCCWSIWCHWPVTAACGALWPRCWRKTAG
jgi:hypothetical protein